MPPTRDDIREALKSVALQLAAISQQSLQTKEEIDDLRHLLKDVDDRLEEIRKEQIAESVYRKTLDAQQAKSWSQRLQDRWIVAIFLIFILAMTTVGSGLLLRNGDIVGSVVDRIADVAIVWLNAPNAENKSQDHATQDQGEKP
jgi:hypothetical protein